MLLWRKLTGILRDRTSLFIATISTKSPNRNPDLEAAIIKATSHDPYGYHFRYTQRVSAWIRSSPHNLKPLSSALSMRLNKTKSWIVALKGLMLMHGVLYCKILDVNRFNRLPFDLSNFEDRESRDGKTWRFEVFVGSYFAFLDRRSELICDDSYERFDRLIEKENRKLQKLQILLDLLIQVKPQTLGRQTVGLILEAMGWIIIDILHVYSKIIKGVSLIQRNVTSVTKSEAEIVLKILQKANEQNDELSRFFEHCKYIGAISSVNCPKIKYVSEGEFEKLEKIINGDSEKKDSAMIIQYKVQGF